MTEIEYAKNYVELTLLEWGREICVPDKNINYYPKDYHVFHYVVNGKGHVEIAGKHYDLHKGAIFYIPPSFRDAHYSADPDDPWTYEWLGFAGPRAERYIETLGLSANHPILYDTKKEIRPIFFNLINEANSVGYLNVICLGYAYELFGTLIKNNVRSETNYSVKALHIQRAKEFILNNYQFNIKVTDVASNVGVSPNYLANIFATLENSSPKKFLIDTRMKNAALLLKTGDYNVKKVGQAVGFTNQLHFSNEFKKYYGVSPLYYKNGKEENR